MNSVAECGPILGSRELVPTFRARIIESHEKGKASDECLRKEILANVNLKRETALLLESAERDLNKPQWRRLKKSLPFDGDAIKAYLSLLHRFPEPAADIKIALAQIKKVLLPISSGNGRGTLHCGANFFTESTLAVIRLTSAFRKYVSLHPLKNWEPQTAELFLRSLKPILNC